MPRKKLADACVNLPVLHCQHRLPHPSVKALAECRSLEHYFLALTAKLLTAEKLVV